MNGAFPWQPLVASVAETIWAFTKSIIVTVFGDLIDRPVIGLLSAGDIIGASVLLFLSLLVGWAVAGWFKSMAARAERKGREAWQKEVLIAVGQPLGMLICLYGVRLALSPVLISLAAQGNESVQVIVDKAFDFVAFGVALWLFFRLTRVIELRLNSWAKKSDSRLDDLLAPLIARLVRVLVPVMAIILMLPVLGLPAAYDFVLGKISSLLVIAAVAWVLFQIVSLLERFVLLKYDIQAADNLSARKVHTQVKVLTKTVYVLIILFTAASMLMLFEEVRRLGTSILASAGVLGIIIGFAAQKTIANLFAGFQLAMTQPIRLDDVVIVENEWGRIEEITLTYVVVRIWDQRRLVVPLSYFIEKPFQNWTRVSSDIMGSVFFFADYTLPIEVVREEVKRIVEPHPKWDKKFWNVQVTDTTERTMQVRVLVTASDSGKAWDLRCELRERLIAFLQQNYPQCLPRMRAEIDDPRREALDAGTSA